MTLTIEKKVTEEVKIDFENPVCCRSEIGQMYYRYEMTDGKIRTTAFDTVSGFSLSVHNHVLNEAALMLEDRYVQVSEEEFYAELHKLLMENNII